MIYIYQLQINLRKVLNKVMTLNKSASLLLGLVLLGMSRPASAQTPQDNWYLEQKWTKSGGGLVATNGGLSNPTSIAIGPDQRIYVGDSSYNRIQVYLPDGTFSFSITNGFGSIRGMITDGNGNLYVADNSYNCVWVFDKNGILIRKVGGITGSGNGQLNAVMDVGVAVNGDIYILEGNNKSRVSVFDNNGAFIRNWGGFGGLAGQLYTPTSLAVAPNGNVYIANPQRNDVEGTYQGVKVFTGQGVYIAKWSAFTWGSDCTTHSPVSVRVDPSGLIHIVAVPTFGWAACGRSADASGWTGADGIYNGDGASIGSYTFGKFNVMLNGACHAVGPDGSVVAVTKNPVSPYEPWIYVLRRAYRDQWAPPRNAISMPVVISKQQRVNSPLVDIDYQVTDADDTNVTVGALI